MRETCFQQLSVRDDQFHSRGITNTQICSQHRNIEYNDRELKFTT